MGGTVGYLSPNCVLSNPQTTMLAIIGTQLMHILDQNSPLCPPPLKLEKKFAKLGHWQLLSIYKNGPFLTRQTAFFIENINFVQNSFIFWKMLKKNHLALGACFLINQF